MFLFGKGSVGFNATKSGSFHFLILPRKISANSLPDNFNLPGLISGKLTTGTIPPITAGIGLVGVVVIIRISSDRQRHQNQPFLQ